MPNLCIDKLAQHIAARETLISCKLLRSRCFVRGTFELHEELDIAVFKSTTLLGIMLECLGAPQSCIASIQSM